MIRPLTYRGEPFSSARSAGILLLLLLLCNQAGAQKKYLTLKVHAADNQPAQVAVQGKVLGNTDQLLKFDITGYHTPISLDLVLSRKGYVPTLYTLEVTDPNQLWEPPPLALLQPIHEVNLRSQPEASRLFVENEDGERQPAGKDGTLSLEVVVPAFGKPVAPREVVVILERDGYLPARLTLSPEVWFVPVYPPPEKPPLVIPEAPGWQAWWIRYSREKPLYLVFSALGLALLLGLARLRYHYLTRIESAHAELRQWVERLDAFVHGSQEMAAPLTIEDLAQTATLQARRLCRAPWALFVCEKPQAFEAVPATDRESFHELLAYLRDKKHPLRLDHGSESRFGGLPEEYPSLLCQPLVFKGEYRGAIIVGHQQPGFFQTVDQEALGVLAAQLAAATERIVLHQETVEAYHKLAESEAQLIQAAKMSAVGQLAAGVAHELNTPLNAITFGVEMAQANLEQQPARAQKRLNLVMTAAKKAGDIVGKLLYYSREARLDDQEFSLKTLLQDTQDFLRFQLDQDALTLQVDDTMDAPLHGNLNELSQVLSNLILNARDSLLRTDADKTITVSLKDRVAAVEILVTDHGEGIADDVVAKIFDPFFTTKQSGEGTGLGLSVSRKIMEKHGGSLLLVSAQKPCCFAMKLPKSLISKAHASSDEAP